MNQKKKKMSCYLYLYIHKKMVNPFFANIQTISTDTLTIK